MVGDERRSSASVQEALQRAGVTFQWKVCARPTRTAGEAAAALGVSVEAIVKSLVFIAGNVPVLVLVAGHHRADLARLSEVLGQQVRRAHGEEVKRATGFAPGVVPPCGHTQRLRTLCDAALLELATVWAAGGAPGEVFALQPQELVRATQAEVVSLSGET